MINQFVRTSIKLGTGKVGICWGGASDEGSSCIGFHQLSRSYEIGKLVPQEQPPSINDCDTVIFFKQESDVDNLISVLEKLKNDFYKTK